jgi:hypothetical protein
MLQLLRELLQPARTSHYGLSADDRLSVRLSVDSGDGPGMLRMTVDRDATAGHGHVTVSHAPGDCARATTVTVDRPDGIRVRFPKVPVFAR